MDDKSSLFLRKREIGKQRDYSILDHCWAMTIIFLQFIWSAIASSAIACVRVLGACGWADDLVSRMI